MPTEIENWKASAAVVVGAAAQTSVAASRVLKSDDRAMKASFLLRVSGTDLCWAAAKCEGSAAHKPSRLTSWRVN